MHLSGIVILENNTRRDSNEKRNRNLTGMGGVFIRLCGKADGETK